LLSFKGVTEVLPLVMFAPVVDEPLELFGSAIPGVDAPVAVALPPLPRELVSPAEEDALDELPATLS
jgi:hypothetical protein